MSKIGSRFLGNIAILLIVYLAGGTLPYIVLTAIEIVVLILINIAYRFVSSVRDVTYSIEYTLASVMDIGSIVTAMCIIFVSTLI